MYSNPISMKKTLTLLLSLVFSVSAMAQDLQSQVWPAKWISVPGAGELDYGVYYFRKNVDLAAVPARYLVHVTGDNRYKLYVNETLVSMGPAKGDALHWNYETVDLAPYLNGGRNVIAALVYNEGPRRPDSQISVRTGFLLQGEAESAELFTDKSWLCIQDPSYSIKKFLPGFLKFSDDGKFEINRTVKLNIPLNNITFYKSNIYYSETSNDENSYDKNFILKGSIKSNENISKSIKSIININFQNDLTYENTKDKCNASKNVIYKHYVYQSIIKMKIVLKMILN